MSITQNRSSRNLVKVRAAMSRRKTLATLRKARQALALKRETQQKQLALLAKAREVLAWQRHLGIA